MIDSLLIVLLLLLAFFVIGFIVTRTASSPLYSDKGIGSKVFKDKVRRIRAMPDRIEGTQRSALLLEYKSRKGGVYNSDVVQAIASVLAARGSGINITGAQIHTRGGSVKTIELGDDASLERKIKHPLMNARIVMSGGVPKATHQKVKCRGCGYNQVCEYSG